MPAGNNQGRLLNDGLNTGIFAALETVQSPAGGFNRLGHSTPGNSIELNYPEEVGSEAMPNFILITVYADKATDLKTELKAKNTRKLFESIVSRGLGGIAGSAATVDGNLFNFYEFNKATNRKTKPSEDKTETPTATAIGASLVGTRGAESYVATTRVAANFQRIPVDSIALYIPGPIQFSMKANYEGKETERRGWGGKIGDWLRGSVQGLADMLSAGGKDNRLLSEGKAKNSNKEIAFKDIDERSFTFEYVFMPKTPKETDAVYQIIRTLRYYAHPSLISATMYGVPAEFEINFFTNGKENEWIPRLRRLVCESIDVTYGEESSGFVTFEDGAPAYISVSMQFREVEPLQKEHIQAGF